VNISTLNTCIGKLWLEADKKYLRRISFLPLEGNNISTPVLELAKQELEEYTNGKRQFFTVPILAKGSPFQEKIWSCLQRIPYGKVWTYRQLAEAAEYPSAFRAAGNANHANPLPIIIPCHRVINSNGDIGGYGGGREIKQKLLNLEAFVTF